MGCFARLVLFLVRQYFEIEEFIPSRNIQQLVVCDHLAVLNIGHREIDVGREAAFDGHVDHDGSRGGLHRARSHDPGQLGCYEKVSLIGGQHRKHMGCVTRLIRLFIRHELYRAVVFDGEVRPPLAAIHRIDIAAKRYHVSFTFVNYGFHFNQTELGNLVIIECVALRARGDIGGR